MDKVKHLENVISSAKELIKVYKKVEASEPNRWLEETHARNTVKLVKNIQGAVDAEDFMKVAFTDENGDGDWKQTLSQVMSKFMINNYSCFSDVLIPSMKKFDKYSPWAHKPFAFSFRNNVKVEHGPVKIGSFINWIFYTLVLYPWHSRCYTDPTVKDIKDVFENSIEVGGL